jgi:hypothetical protein
MKTLIAFIIFEVFAFFAVIFYFEGQTPKPKAGTVDVERIEHVNDSIAVKLIKDSLRFDNALKQSKQMRKEVETLTKHK